MTTLEQIRQVQNELTYVEGLLSKPRFQRGILYWFRTYSLRAKVDGLKRIRFNMAVSYLMAHDEIFAGLAKENLRLFENDRVHFKVQATGFHFFNSYSTCFEGRIADNGHVYCHVIKHSSPMNTLMSRWYPSHLKGKIDCFGNIRIATSKTKRIFPTSQLPKSFDGAVDSAGNIELHISDVETGILAHGQTMIDKLIANLLGGDRNRLRTFVSNRDALVSSVDALIAKL